MPASAHFDTQLLVGFLLTLTRVGAALILLPMPGFENSNQVARIALIAGSTLCLVPVWPVVARFDESLSLPGAVILETTVGLLVGLTTAFLFETFQIGTQIISFQTGFGFATTFDPQSQADSAIFQLFSKLCTGFLFFALGIHRELIGMLARSFTTLSPSLTQGYAARGLSLGLVLHLGTKMFVDGVKLALPVVVLLFLVDLSLAALTRLQTQLQLLSVAFPVKIVLSIIFFGALLMRWSDLFQRFAAETFNQVFRTLAL